MNSSNQFQIAKVKNAKCSDEKYKTELCQKYCENGFCPYGNKCRFAHGKDELVYKKLCNNYKKKQCKTFFECGYCPYGTRCTFKHNEFSFYNTRFIFSSFTKIFLFNENASSVIEGKGHMLQIFDEIVMLSNNNKDNLIGEHQRKYSSSFSTVSNEE